MSFGLCYHRDMVCKSLKRCRTNLPHESCLRYKSSHTKITFIIFTFGSSQLASQIDMKNQPCIPMALFPANHNPEEEKTKYRHYHTFSKSGLGRKSREQPNLTRRHELRVHEQQECWETEIQPKQMYKGTKHGFQSFIRFQKKLHFLHTVYTND